MRSLPIIQRRLAAMFLAMALAALALTPAAAGAQPRGGARDVVAECRALRALVSAELGIEFSQGACVSFLRTDRQSAAIAASSCQDPEFVALFFGADTPANRGACVRVVREFNRGGGS